MNIKPREPKMETEKEVKKYNVQLGPRSNGYAVTVNNVFIGDLIQQGNGEFGLYVTTKIGLSYDALMAIATKFKEVEKR